MKHRQLNIGMGAFLFPVLSYVVTTRILLLFGVGGVTWLTDDVDRLSCCCDADDDVIDRFDDVIDFWAAAEVDGAS